MAGDPKEVEALREEILRDPGQILEDREIMKALLQVQDDANGANVVDLRGAFLKRLESRLDRLERTHANVVSAAYDNVSGTQQIHRAVLSLLDTRDLSAMLDRLRREAAPALGVDFIALVVAGAQGALESVTRKDVIRLPEKDLLRLLGIKNGRAPRDVTLRASSGEASQIFGDHASGVKSEALLFLDLGENAQGAFLYLGSEDADMFGPEQATELLGFFAEALERLLRAKS